MSPPAPPATTNLADLVRAAAGTAGQRSALVSPERQVSWAALDRQVDAVAAGLLDAGLAPGDRVLLALPNGIEFVAAYFGTLRAGGVAVPVNPEGSADELTHQLSDCGARAVLGSAAAVARIGPPGLMGVTLVRTDVAALAATTVPAVSARGGGESLAVLLYTSGTTGRPRAAMLSHRALLANLEQLARLPSGGVTGSDVVLLVLPFFHVYGLNAALGSVVRQAATGVLLERFDPVATLEAIRRHRVSYVLGAPPMFVTWAMLPEAELGEAFAGVRVAVSGAAPLPDEVAAAFAAATGVQVQQGYGLTEASPVVTTTLAAPAKAGSVGRPLPGVELVVDNGGAPPGEADPGEVLIRGDNLFSGYWPDGAAAPEDDGWFATGDVGYLDRDGELFLVDRLRDIVLVSGFNVYPREVEQVLAAHPGVAAVAVVGVPHPYTGETVKALVVRAEDAAGLTEEELIAYAGRRLARFKCPTAVEFVDALPDSDAGKPLRRTLRALRLPRPKPQ